ncbi:MAG: CHASE2 domain-containing protein [Desulfovibrionales bacterium]|nr:CHASE2 domain-containing protein [Desulfovibrionales bacterium]
MRWIAVSIYRLLLKVGKRLKANFYLYLAGIFTIVVFADSLALNITAGMKQASFDLMIKNRIVVRKPDPDIVIVDINEASLADMAKDYGRWPWPRQVMGEFVEQIEKQRPRAVVFDILFSDPDVFNPESDAYFNAAISNTDNTFFPVLRLDPENDRLSSVLPEQIPGTIPVQGEAMRGKPVAVVLPFFEAALNGGRLGIHNIYPDNDGIARQYPVHRRDYGWLIPSLPARVVKWLGMSLPERDNILINWRGKPFAYHYVSFTDVFFDMTSKDHRRSQNEFTGKIVLIGSTAAGLFDVKATPMDRLHPGVEILATAIDNLKHDDYLRVPDTKWFNLVLALLIIWTTAIALFKNVGQEKFDRFFSASQFLLIGISYVSINLMTAYINLTGPVMLGVAYFTCARIYSFGARKILEKSAVMSSLASEGKLYAALMLIRFGGGPGSASEKAVARIRSLLGRHGIQARSVEALKGLQKGIWGLFEGMIAVSWTCPADDEKGRSLIMKEAKTVEEAAAELWQTGRGTPDGISFIFHEGRIDGGEQARSGWTLLFGEALMRRNEAGRK